jgi:hypothetical protein
MFLIYSYLALTLELEEDLSKTVSNDLVVSEIRRSKRGDTGHQGTVFIPMLRLDRKVDNFF